MNPVLKPFKIMAITKYWGSEFQHMYASMQVARTNIKIFNCLTFHMKMSSMAKKTCSLSIQQFTFPVKSICG